MRKKIMEFDNMNQNAVLVFIKNLPMTKQLSLLRKMKRENLIDYHKSQKSAI